MLYYKGFDKNMQCRGFQYVEGETYTHDGDVDLCSTGFHVCEIPLDVLSYYPLGAGNQYHTVEVDQVSAKTAEDSKRVGKTITVGGKLNLFGLIQAHVEVVTEKAGKSEGDAATSGDYANAATSGDYAHAATSGDYAHAATSGDYANAATSGYGAHAATSGDYAHAATSGDYAHAATSGYGAHAATSGDYAHAATSGSYAHAATSGYGAHAATSGDYAHAATSGSYAHAATSGYGAHAATSGDYAHAATSGNEANAATSGYGANAATSGSYANAATTGYSAQIRSSVHDPDAVAAVLGEGAARGVKGSWLVLTERDGDWNLIEVRAVQVDGETVKENQYYRLSGGNLVEVND